MNGNRLKALLINLDFVDNFILWIDLIGLLHFIYYSFINSLIGQSLLISITNSSIIYYILIKDPKLTTQFKLRYLDILELANFV